jgi:hypothetical protein
LRTARGVALALVVAGVLWCIVLVVLAFDAHDVANAAGRAGPPLTSDAPLAAPLRDARDAYHRVVIALFAGAVVILSGMLLVGRWMDDAMRRIEHEDGPGGWTVDRAWARIGWLVPIANVVVPGLLLLDLWRRSDRPDPADRSTGPLVPMWWVAWGATSLGWALVAWSNPYWKDASDVSFAIDHDEYRALYRLGVAWGLAATLAMALAAALVVTIDQRLERRLAQRPNVSA